MLVVQKPPANADVRDLVSTPELGRSLEREHGNSLQWTEEPGRLQSWGHTESDTEET